MFPSYNNQLTDLYWNSTDWFLYDRSIGIYSCTQPNKHAQSQQQKPLD